MLNVFLSYNFQDQDFVTKVYRLLRKQPDLRCYFYREDNRLDSWRKLISQELGDAVRLILFVGSELGKTQQKEAAWFAKKYKKKDVPKKAITVCLPSGGRETLRQLIQYTKCRTICVEGWGDDTRSKEEAAGDCAREIAVFLTRRKWISDDDLPLGYPFAYEKDIIQAYAIPEGDRDDRRKVRLGCPENWPTVEKAENETDPGYDNPLREAIIGSFRKEEDQVLVDARSVYHAPNRETALLSHLAGSNLTFPEAGPRATLRFPPQGTNRLTVGLLVSGGIAPGINAVLSGIVERHTLYADPPATALRDPQGDYRRYKLRILGFRDGLAGVLDGTKTSDLSREEDWHQSFLGMANEGGSKIGTSALRSRLEPLRQFVQTLRKYEEHILTFVETGLTNAVAEGVNRVIRMVKNRASGFSSLAAFSDLIFLTIGDVDILGKFPNKFRIP